MKKKKIVIENFQKKINDLDFLKQFIDNQGKIIPRSITGVNVQNQKQISKAIKRNRVFGLLPFIIAE